MLAVALRADAIGDPGRRVAGASIGADVPGRTWSGGVRGGGFPGEGWGRAGGNRTKNGRLSEEAE